MKNLQRFILRRLLGIGFFFHLILMSPLTEGNRLHILGSFLKIANIEGLFFRVPRIQSWLETLKVDLKAPIQEQEKQLLESFEKNHKLNEQANYLEGFLAKFISTETVIGAKEEFVAKHFNPPLIPSSISFPASVSGSGENSDSLKEENNPLLQIDSPQESTATAQNATDEDLLLKAIQEGDEVSVKYFLGKGTPSHFIHGEFAYTPLHFAVMCNQLGIVQLLIREGAPIDTPDKFGNTPLLLAVLYQRTPFIPLFLQNKADIFASNGSDNSPLIAAIEKEYMEAIELFDKEHEFAQDRDSNRRISLAPCSQGE